MTDEHESDHYEVLQVSPRADGDTIERVFRHLAKRLHPDNAESGNAERFSQVVQAFRILSDPEERARYDAGYKDARRKHWKIFDQMASTRNVEADRRMRLGLMTVLYQARRRDVDHPGMGIIDLEQILDSPEEAMRFHLWYLKERGWIQRLDNGFYAITANGVDELNSEDIPWAEPALLPAGSVDASGPGTVDSEESGQPSENGRTEAEEAVAPDQAP